MDSEEMTKMPLAKWPSRIFAWLIDAAIISAALVLLSMVFPQPDVIPDDFMIVESIVGSLVFFAYWVVMEYMTGQTIGKRLLNLRVVDISGRAPSLGSTLLNCFGKAFILPIDVILGWFVARENKQRAFSKLAGVVVVKTEIPMY